MSQWRENPSWFVWKTFGVEPDDWQHEALCALRDHKRVSIRACHGPGKTAFDAWAIYWFMATRFPTRIPCTAPTFHQLNDILWAELAKWHQVMTPGLRTCFDLSNDRLAWAAAPLESFAVARTARKEQPEALQGFHCDNLLFVIDEASGVPEPIFEVAEGALTGEDAYQILTSNPTQTAGYFFDSHHKMRHRFYPMKVGASDSPRVSDAYVEDMAQKYGADSNVYRIRVLGEFPLSEDDVVIPLQWIEEAKYREVLPTAVEEVWGLDVARFGDDENALAKRRGNTVTEKVRTWHGVDLMETAGKIVVEYEDALIKPARINVDVIGIGAGVKDRLKEEGLPVVGINVAESPSSRDRFLRLRDEMWWKGREWFESRAVKINGEDEELIGELCNVHYRTTSAGKIQVESKDEMKKRGVASPNRADALLHTFIGRERPSTPGPTTYTRRQRIISRHQRRGGGIA